MDKLEPILSPANADVYSAGHLRNPQKTDKRFSLRRDARDHAIEGARDMEVWAVWHDASGAIVNVIYDGESFS